MFTGIIHGLGKIEKIDSSAGEAEFEIAPLFVINDYTKGESIAINGVCLTVEKFSDKSFKVYASKETLSKTNLGKLSINSKVNLERAVRLQDRLGGHLVSGHIDGLAKICSIDKAGASTKFVFEYSKNLFPFLVDKGSVCLDGISLTINECDNNTFNVNIIPETRTVTTINSWKVGDYINIETDIIGKYVHKHLSAQDNKDKKDISFEFLRENGYM